MNFLNLDVKTLRGPELLGSEPVDRATWLTLLTYCMIQENGGHIEGAAMWGDRKWMQLVGVTKAEIERQCDLWKWEENALVVFAYPTAQERTILHKRKAGKKFAKKRWGENKSKNGSPNGSPIESPNTERKGMEEEGKGMEDTPLPPDGGQNGAKGFTDGKGPASKLLPTTPQALRVAAIMHRRPETAWSEQEVKAYKKLKTIPEEDLAAVEAFYAANWPPRRDVNLLRHNLGTFLNNFSGEVDRARASADAPPPTPHYRKTSDEGYIDA